MPLSDDPSAIYGVEDITYRHSIDQEQDNGSDAGLGFGVDMFVFHFFILWSSQISWLALIVWCSLLGFFTLAIRRISFGTLKLCWRQGVTPGGDFSAWLAG
jgi:hypothetical protein